MSNLYIGLISGTSMDGIEAVLVDFSEKTTVIAAHTEPFPEALKTRLEALHTDPSISLLELGNIDVMLGKAFAQAGLAVLNKSPYSAKDIKAIGSHGQNIYHHPHGETPFSLQIGNPHWIAEITGIKTIADFRQRDVASGGQGAPLAPLLHSTLMKSDTVNRAIVNIGGIANVSLLPHNHENVIGFDTGPGNGLSDAWILKHKNKPFDHNGTWAASGKVNKPLLEKLLNAPYFSKSIPKSTGKEYFNLAWLEKHLTNESPEDVQATLIELTAHSILKHIKADEIYICGGGVYNQYLMERLSILAAPSTVQSTAALGVEPGQVEAILFAWLAKCRLDYKKMNTASITGARKPVLLGTIYEV